MNPWRGLRDLPKEIWILAAATLVNRAGTMVLPFLVLYLTRTLGITPAHAALALTVYGVAALLTMPVAGRLSDRLGPLVVMKASLLLSGVLLLLFPLAHHFAAILVVTFFFAMLNESVRPPVRVRVVLELGRLRLPRAASAVLSPRSSVPLAL